MRYYENGPYYWVLENGKPVLKAEKPTDPNHIIAYHQNDRDWETKRYHQLVNNIPREAEYMSTIDVTDRAVRLMDKIKRMLEKNILQLEEK